MTKQPVLVVAAVIQRQEDPEGRILVVRRGPEQSGAGFWEFPGGKVEAGEAPEQALVREITEELALNIRVHDLIGEEDFAYPSKTIRLRVYWASVKGGEELVLTEHDDFKWQRPEEIDVMSLSAADRPFVAKIQNSYGKR
ncbi:(deoxy)nucleoside triphosphate pyrophosphohydrolase [Bdellovibrio bacteriovorus]|uniref:8-oxo-dGTP diphosphatase n=1 Tax=Bdellovibrio bacteriovorus str. Tiberius TaxID=1069642 RepID=K7YW16_BDEBC|nr:(deoxy)nucleoside triphosphate pyrophosphohydrolase [Bdellovibrio bacteriovorus]AFY01858.1 MutT/NUDIX family hydrolase /pyrophosphatase [Bdellovibrio bacteriovorus str. Tiberius]